MSPVGAGPATDTRVQPADPATSTAAAVAPTPASTGRAASARTEPVSYRYEAFDADRTIQRGVVTATDRSDAANRVRSLGLRPLTITEHRTPLFSRELRLPGSAPKVKTRDLAVFARQLSTMVGAGVPIVTALEVLAGQTSSPQLVEAIDDITRGLRSGDSLADAMGRHPSIFDPVFAAMVGAGEASGSLDQVLGRLSVTLERRVAVTSKIRSAMGYPIAVLSLTGLIVIGMLLFVVPVFVSMYDQLEGELPVATQVMVGLSSALRGNFLLILAAVVGLVVGFRRWRRTEGGQDTWDRLVLQLPIVGSLVRRAAMARFARTLAVLARAGVPILDGLELAGRVVKNRCYVAAVERVSDLVRKGSPLAEPLEDEPLFPPLASQLVAVGEQTGELDTMLDLMGGYYEDELDHTVDSLSSLMEPALMIVLGVVVGGIVITLYLPMFRLIELIQ